MPKDIDSVNKTYLQFQKGGENGDFSDLLSQSLPSELNDPASHM